jgi:hypothetical protein
MYLSSGDMINLAPSKDKVLGAPCTISIDVEGSRKF